MTDDKPMISSEIEITPAMIGARTGERSNPPNPPLAQQIKSGGRGSSRTTITVSARSKATPLNGYDEHDGSRCGQNN
jgi:hypothetical protein